VFFISFNDISGPLQQIGYLPASFFSLFLQGQLGFINMFFNINYFWLTSSLASSLARAYQAFASS
jgi:hypothetical protein